MLEVDQTAPSEASELQSAWQQIRDEARRLAGGPGDMPQRVALMHSIFRDSGGNHAFPEVALHGALWAYGFYERRGVVSRMISYRYFYDRDERARRAYMLFVFSQGFKEANRSVFMDTYANYFFTKRFGEADGADSVVAPALLEALNRVHHAARSGRSLTAGERRDVFETSLLFEQESTVGPKVKEEVSKFDCPVLTRIVLRPIVHFSYFPRKEWLVFHDFSKTEERIEKAMHSYDLAARVGWPHVGECIRYAGVLPDRFFADPLGYADGLRAAAAA
ncbi:MAG: hypothetical protein JOZ25_10985 [Actinobacteria bacterium]|nr:hypothetical protein [Actinomycetota bacterium]